MRPDLGSEGGDVVVDRNLSGNSPTRCDKAGSIFNKAFYSGRRLEHTATEGRGSVENPAPRAKMAEDIEVARSSPKPILARQNLPKPTFSSFEEYEDNILARPVCSARPSRDNMFLNGFNFQFSRNLRNHQKQRDGLSQTIDRTDALESKASSSDGKESLSNAAASPPQAAPSMSLQPQRISESFTKENSDSVPPTSKEEEAIDVTDASMVNATEDEEKESSKLATLINAETTHGPLASPRGQTPAQRTPLSTPMILQTRLDLQDSGCASSEHALGERHVKAPAEAGISTPAASCRKFPSFEQALLNDSFSSKICEPLNSRMSPLSSLDDIVDGKVEVGANLSHSEIDGRPSSDSSHIFKPSEGFGILFSPSSDSDSVQSLKVRRRRQKARQNREEEVQQPALKREEPQIVRKSRSLNLCAGNSAELCDPVPDESAKERERKPAQEQEEQYSEAHKALIAYAKRYRQRTAIHELRLRLRQCRSQGTLTYPGGDAKISETHEGSSDGELESLPTSLFVNMDRSNDEGVFLDPYFKPRKIAIPQLSMHSPAQDSPQSMNPSSPDSSHFESPIHSRSDSGNLFEGHSPQSLFQAGGYSTQMDWLIKPVMIRRKPESTPIKAGGFSLERALKKRTSKALPNYDALDPREPPCRGFRQIEKKDNVVATVFSKGKDAYKSFRPVKLHWHHGMWHRKAPDTDKDMRENREKSESGDNPQMIPSQLEIKEKISSHKKEETRDDSVHG
ncbi:MAG: hypothetical protein Q9165_002975 [Trypethelium subeluteriae]